MSATQASHPNPVTATPLPIDWDRIESLQPTVRKAAIHLARTAGEDFDEMIAAFNAKIAETAAVNPQFLGPDNTPAYIVTFAYRRVISDFRKTRARDASHHSDGGEDGENVAVGLSGTDELQIGPKLARFVETLDQRCQEVWKAALEAGDQVFKANGSLNVLALAEFMDKPDQTLQYRVTKMRAAWANEWATA